MSWNSTIRAVERGKAVIFRGPGTQRGAQDSNIYLILSHFSLMLGHKKCEISPNFDLMLKSRGEYGARKRTK